jgi:large subunit ribosomal protein L5
MAARIKENRQRTRIRLKKGDTVKVIAGKDLGKTGKVLRVIPDKGRLIVEGVNFVKKHSRRTREERDIGVSQVPPNQPHRHLRARRRHQSAPVREMRRDRRPLTRLEGNVIKPRLKKKYEEEVVPAMMAERGYRNRHQVPRVVKIALNTGLGRYHDDIKVFDAAVGELAAITGQRPVVTRAKRSVANFKVRAGMPSSVRVTLRRDRMYEFLDRLISFALPRVRDFRGLDPESFDGHGNYTLGITEQIIFPEIDYDKVVKITGMNVTVTTSAPNDEEARNLLAALGMPFGRPRARR